jgi:hypothetical protein
MVQGCQGTNAIRLQLNSDSVPIVELVSSTLLLRYTNFYLAKVQGSSEKLMYFKPRSQCEGSDVALALCG